MRGNITASRNFSPGERLLTCAKGRWGHSFLGAACPRGEGGVTGSRDAGRELAPGQVNPWPVRLPSTRRRKAAELRFPLGYNIKPALHGSEVQRSPPLLEGLRPGEGQSHSPQSRPGATRRGPAHGQMPGLRRAAGKALKVHWGESQRTCGGGTVTEESQVFAVSTHT